jgi:hypothetical protein
MGPKLEIVGSDKSARGSMAFPSDPESSSYLLGVLSGSRAILTLRWMMPRMIHGEVAS